MKSHNFKSGDKVYVQTTLSSWYKESTFPATIIEFMLDDGVIVKPHVEINHGKYKAEGLHFCILEHMTLIHSPITLDEELFIL